MQKASRRFDPAGSPLIGVARITHDTHLIRYDDGRTDIAKGETRNCFAEVELVDQPKASVAAMNGQGHFLVADDRCTFKPGKSGEVQRH